MKDFYYFQNPNSGYPMILGDDDDGKPMVWIDSNMDVDPSEEDHKDAKTYTKAVARCKTLLEAASILRREYGAADIMD